MPSYDVVLLHPPRVFREAETGLRSRLRGALSGGRHQEPAPQYPLVSSGAFGLASGLAGEGFKVRLFNLALEQFLNPSFSLESFLRGVESEIYCIGLNWFVHCPGALEAARACKALRPDCLVVLGGLTASWFADQVMARPFIDAVVLGEADESLLDLVKARFARRDLSEVNGLCYREHGQVRRTPPRQPPENIDTPNGAELSLLEHWEKYLRTSAAGFREGNVRAFWLSTARGCRYNCIHCGGGREAYQLWTGRPECKFRSPERIADEIEEVVEKGVESVKLSHDPEMGGEKFASQLLREVKARQLDFQLYYESFRLPTEGFLRALRRCCARVEVGVSPESASEAVRGTVGKDFSNHDLLKAVEEIRRHGFGVRAFFSFGMPGETFGGLQAFASLARAILERGGDVVPPFPYTIDPNCLMAVNPERYGVNLLLRSFDDYLEACSSEEAIGWVGHETRELTREGILRLTASAEAYVSQLYRRAR